MTVTIERRENDQPDGFAYLSLICFLLVCFAVLGIITMGIKLPEWGGTVIGSVLGYWSANISQVFGFKYGSSQSSRDNRQTINRMVESNAATATALAEKVPTPPSPPLAPAAEPVAVVPVAPQEVSVQALGRPGDASKIYVLPDGTKHRWTGDAYEQVPQLPR